MDFFEKRAARALRRALRAHARECKDCDDCTRCDLIARALSDDDVFGDLLFEVMLRYRKSRGLGDGEIIDSIIEFLKWLLENGDLLVKLIQAIIDIFLEEQPAAMAAACQAV